MTRMIEDVEGLSADARRLFDWMIAAFTGDVNEALADAKRVGAKIAEWPRERLRAAHAELKARGVLAADAPDLQETGHATRRRATKKSPAQLAREVAEVLAKPPGTARERTDEELKKSGLCTYCGRPTRRGSALIDGWPAHKTCVAEYED